MSDDGGTDDRVPRSRLAQETERLRAAQARVGELETELRAAKGDASKLAKKAGSYDDLVSSNQQLQAKIEELNQARADDVEIMRRGFTDIELVRFEHSRAGEDAGTVVEWLEKLKDAKPETAPENLRRFLVEPGDDKGGAGADDKGSATDASDKGGTSRDANNGAGQGGPAGEGKVSQARIRELYTEALNTGDWGPYREARGIPNPSG